MAKQKQPKTRGPGRPPVNPPGMDVRKAIRLFPEEDDAWCALATADGRSFSDWARRQIRISLGQPPS